MCGIAGFFAADGAPMKRADLVAMTDSLQHRGPDGAGYWVSPGQNCMLGHRRLAIIDVDIRSDQPMVGSDGRYVLVFNGEIYNFLELRSELERGGIHFRTEGDTEVVLEAWKAWGPGMFGRFNGMWALVIFDTLKQQLILSRDRFGVKPLLFAQRGNRLAFASEMRAFGGLDWVDRTLDVEAARRAAFDPFTVEASDRTLARGISRIGAGHWATFDKSGLAVERWWRTTDHLVDPPASLATAAEEFRARFFEAVTLRMRSDVPVGTCLSGGFDSSAILATMSAVSGGSPRQSEDWRHAFVASFPGCGHDETVAAQCAADYAGVRPTMIDLSRDPPLEHLDEVLDTMEDVFIGLPTAVWKIYRAVSGNGVRVSLDGHGADEMIGGYRSGGRNLQFHLRNLLGNSAGRSRWSTLASDATKVAFLRSQGNYFLRGAAIPQRFDLVGERDDLPKDWSVLNRRLYAMFHSTILPTLLRNFDRLSMAHSVEVRMPFMDWRLVTYAMSLPDSFKADSSVSKLVARQAMKGRMPESIRSDTRKVGFGSQMPEWLNAGLGRWMLDRLERPNDAFDAIVDRRGLSRRIARLNARGAWNWETAGRLWPYLALHWHCERNETVAVPIRSSSADRYRSANAVRLAR